MLALKYRNSGIRVHTHSLDDKRATVKMSMSISFFMCTRTISFQAKKDIVHVFVLCRLSQQRRAASTVQRTHNRPERMAKSHSHKIKRVFVRRSLFVACTSISFSLSISLSFYLFSMFAFNFIRNEPRPCPASNAMDGRYSGNGF